MKERTMKGALVIVLAAVFLAVTPCGGISQVDEGLVVGTVFNDTDLFPAAGRAVTLNIVVDRNFMGRVEPGQTLDIALAPRLEPYEMRAYVFNWDGSSFFAVVDLPLTYSVVVPISHRGRLSSFWVAFEGIP
jgi:hypothetical protein